MSEPTRAETPSISRLQADQRACWERGETPRAFAVDADLQPRA